MKNLFILVIILISSLSFSQAQKSIEIITPKNVKKVINISQLKNYPTHTLDSIQITNHLKEYKSTIKNIKGVLLKDVLSTISFEEKSPKVLSEYYVVCIAEDNYKVVFSWNEIFNTTTGDNVLIIPEIEGRQKDGISTVSPTDFATGRRYVKNLSKILIKHFE